MRLKLVDGFVFPVVLVVIVACATALAIVKVVSKGHETPCQEAVEEVLEDVIKHELETIVTADKGQA